MHIDQIVSNLERKAYERDKSIHVYAELSRKQYDKILKGEVTMEIPYGVTMKNKSGSRGLHFDCDTVECANELKDGLDNSFIVWQEN